MKAKLINVIAKIHSVEVFLAQYAAPTSRVVNIGSSSTRYSHDSVNLDVQYKPGVDAVGDAHGLPFACDTFDVAVLTAVLQHCRDPYQVSAEIHRILKPNGYVYVDAPFVQPYCHDTADLFRFTKDGLSAVFGRHFTIVECDVSIPGASALAFYLQAFVGNTRSKHVNFLLKSLASLVLLPFSLTRYNRRSTVAGAFYLVGQKVPRSTAAGRQPLDNGNQAA